jgi:hypothetical protein
MAIANWVDRGTQPMRSSHINALQDAVGKIEDMLEVDVVGESGVALTAVTVSGDEYRIFQAPIGKRNWLSSPTPVIKKNGSVISTGFIIDHAGGTVEFATNLLVGDVITADVTYTTNISKAPKYFWTEEKTVTAGNNSFVLSNTVEDYMELEIIDLTYGVRWLETTHWTRGSQTITFTEASLSETLTFSIKAL